MRIHGQLTLLNIHMTLFICPVGEKSFLSFASMCSLNIQKSAEIRRDPPKAKQVQREHISEFVCKPTTVIKP